MFSFYRAGSIDKYRHKIVKLSGMRGEGCFFARKMELLANDIRGYYLHLVGEEAEKFAALREGKGSEKGIKIDILWEHGKNLTSFAIHMTREEMEAAEKAGFVFEE